MRTSLPSYANRGIPGKHVDSASCPAWELRPAGGLIPAVWPSIHYHVAGKPGWGLLWGNQAGSVAFSPGVLQNGTSQASLSTPSDAGGEPLAGEPVPRSFRSPSRSEGRWQSLPQAWTLRPEGVGGCLSWHGDGCVQGVTSLSRLLPIYQAH